MNKHGSTHLPWLGTARTSRATLRVVRAAVLVGLAYYVGARVGMELTRGGSPVSMFWIPNALLLSAFLLLPMRAWSPVLLAALPAHLLVELGSGVPLPMVVCWFVSNSMEALIGAIGVRHYAPRGPFRFDRFSNVALFVLFAVVIGTVASSFLDAAFVSLNRWGENGYWVVWRNRVFANALATVTVVPLVIAWSSGYAAIKRASFERWMEFLTLTSALVGVSLFAFGMRAATPVTAWLYAALPLLLWATVRFGQMGQSMATIAVVLVAVWGAGHGSGPFPLESAAGNTLAVQLLFTPVAITLMSLPALIEERRKAQALTLRKTEQLQLAMDAAHMAMWDWPVTDTVPPPPPPMYRT
jgi:integral membrane sensor domain MASE1